MVLTTLLLYFACSVLKSLIKTVNSVNLEILTHTDVINMRKLV